MFNLEGPRPITIKYLTETIREILDIPMDVQFGSSRPGDYEGKEVSAEKARRVLGWSPDTSFEEGMRRYVEWYLAEAEGRTERALEA